MQFVAFATLLALLLNYACAFARPEHPRPAAYHARHAHERRTVAPTPRKLHPGSAPPRGGLSKRSPVTRWTYFTPGLGKCGAYSSGADYIVALNSAQWEGGKHCWKKIRMEYGGKTMYATVVDECPDCPWGGLDLSPSLFSYFGPQSLGVISGSWSF